MYFVVQGSRNGRRYQFNYKPSDFSGFDNPVQTARHAAYDKAASIRCRGGRVKVKTIRKRHPTA